ncbi:hypothetical protein [Nocardiopsis chromatogenes]|uniref:hypothetical protein n=1 Tax=Nocardiopsis chromatogenes TaxID=280239 RepID=UPI000348BE11|nr:hypothetical protein [Nocardiopsis chromatogenes]
MTLERGNAFTPVASATMIWPWGWALGAGAATGAVSFLLNMSIGSGLTTGIFFFALVGGAVALIGSKGDRRARRWAGQYPWKFAGAPALAGGIGVALVTLLTGGGLIGGVFAGLGTVALLWVILGLIGTVAGGGNR